MDDDIKSNDVIETPADVSRRAFIKGVIGSGATPTTPCAQSNWCWHNQPSARS
jgi:hypothetical protein